MKCTGKYKDVSIDFRTSKLTLTVEVNEEMWSRILEKSGDYEESVKEALIELDEWVRDNFNEHEVFTIAGL